MKPIRTPQAHQSEVPLDTLGKVADRSNRLFGYCLICCKELRPPKSGSDESMARSSHDRAGSK